MVTCKGCRFNEGTEVAPICGDSEPFVRSDTGEDCCRHHLDAVHLNEYRRGHRCRYWSESGKCVQCGKTADGWLHYLTG